MTVSAGNVTPPVQICTGGGDTTSICSKNGFFVSRKKKLMQADIKSRVGVINNSEPLSRKPRTAWAAGRLTMRCRARRQVGAVPRLPFARAVGSAC